MFYFDIKNGNKEKKQHSDHINNHAQRLYTYNHGSSLIMIYDAGGWNSTNNIYSSILQKLCHIKRGTLKLLLL